MKTIKINKVENGELFAVINEIFRDLTLESNDVYYINCCNGGYKIINQATRTSVKIEANKHFGHAVRLIREEFERLGMTEEEVEVPADKDETAQPEQLEPEQPTKRELDFRALWEEAQAFTFKYDGSVHNNVYLVNKINGNATSAAEIAFTVPEWNAVLAVLASVPCSTCALTEAQAKGIVMVQQAEFYGGSLLQQSTSAGSMMRAISNIYSTYFIVLENTG